MRKAGRVAKLGLVVDINGLQKRDTSSVKSARTRGYHEIEIIERKKLSCP